MPGERWLLIIICCAAICDREALLRRQKCMILGPTLIQEDPLLTEMDFISSVTISTTWEAAFSVSFLIKWSAPIFSFASTGRRFLEFSRINNWKALQKSKHSLHSFSALSSEVSTTYNSQSTATSKLMSWVGRPTAVRMRSIVTSPALGILAAPTLARVAVKLQKQKSNGSSRKRNMNFVACSCHQ